MKSSNYDGNIKSMRNQRNILIVLCCILGLPLILISLFLFMRSQRIVIIPAVVDREFWVEEKAVSPSYLEQFGTFIGQLILNRSPYNIDLNKKILMKHVDPGFSGALVERLDKEKEMLAKGNGSYVFYTSSIQVSPESKSVLISGKSEFKAGSKVISEEQETYLLGFSYKNGKLLLNRIENIPSK